MRGYEPDTGRVKELAHRYLFLTPVEIQAILRKFWGWHYGKEGSTGDGEIFPAAYNLLGWANTIKIQRKILRAITHGHLVPDVGPGGKAGVQLREGGKGFPTALGFYTMAELEAAMETVEQRRRARSDRRAAIKEGSAPRAPRKSRAKFIRIPIDEVG